jgi:hypothetical protein
VGSKQADNKIGEEQLFDFVVNSLDEEFVTDLGGTVKSEVKCVGVLNSAVLNRC